MICILSISILVNNVDHLFFFNLRAYDRLNRTAALIEQEEKSGVKYQDIQRAEAEEIMSEGVHPITEESDADKNNSKERVDETRAKLAERRKEFEAQRESAGLNRETTSVDSIAKDAMLNGGKVSEEAWEGDTNIERENFVQEELYVHSKVLIADDKIAICGSANINDRVSFFHTGLHSFRSLTDGSSTVTTRST